MHASASPAEPEPELTPTSESKPERSPASEPELKLVAELDLINKTNLITNILKIEIQPFINAMIQADQAQNGFSKETFSEKINAYLDKLQQRSNQLNQVMEQISEIKVADKTFINISALQEEQHLALRGATSIDDLGEKLDKLVIKLQQNLKTHQITAEYLNQKIELQSLKFGKKDPVMDDFLTRCDAAVMKDGKMDESLMATQIKLMKQTTKGLNSKENQEIRSIIAKNEGNKWHSLGMDKKARTIENAMISMPIEERIKLQESKNPVISAALNKTSAFNNFKDRFNALKKDTTVESENTFRPK
jgi:hypothetical protein